MAASTVASILFFALQASAGPPRRYAIELEDPPLALSAKPSHSLVSEARRFRIIKAQESLRTALARRSIRITGAVQTLANAVFVELAPERVADLRSLPGVQGVTPMATLHRKLNQALYRVDAGTAWSALGGAANAGAGIKIAVLDTGIDETHPGFQDAALAVPEGFPRSGNADDAAHATNKIIAVRSFVGALAIGDGAPEHTRPDDLSARDRVGHGTAVAMIAAGVPHEAPLGAISGIAPKAWLGNYKIFGSPGVNDATTSDVVLQALEAAFNDGMDVALLSAGDLPAMWGPADSGAACGLAAGAACDPFVGAVATAVQGGMVIVVPAGNDGKLGAGTINSPGDSSDAITAGATTNTHIVTATLSTAAGDRMPARLGDGPQLVAPLSAPLFAVSSIDSTEHGCFGFPAGALSGRIALLTAGQCSIAAKVLNAQAAGAAGIVVSNQPGGPELFPPSGLGNTAIPAAMVSASSGAFLKAYLSAHPGAVVTLDPAAVEMTATPDTIAYYSSRGPNIGDLAIKPDLVAPGSSIYTATQTYDPNGELYNATRYVGVDGTSFAAAFVAGAAALVKQAHPGYSSAQIKSALVDTADPAISDSDANGNSFRARTTAAGAGKLDIGAALASTLTFEPAGISFGAVNDLESAKGVLARRSLVVTNTGSAPATLQFTVHQWDQDSHASVTVSPAALTLAPGQSENVTISLDGTSSAGFYEGVIVVTGGAVPVQVPYLYLKGDGIPASQVPLLGHDFVTEAGSAVHVAFRVVDQYGAPVTNMPVRFAPPASVYAAASSTDALGIAEAYMYTPGATGVPQLFSADLMGNAGRAEFQGRTRASPQIAAGALVDAASFQVPAGFAPGSYMSVFGSGLSESDAAARTSYLPLSLAGASVSLDVPAAGIHVPARLSFVSPGQVSLQIPWELAGQSSAMMKLTLGGSASRNVRADNSSLSTFQTQIVTVPLAAYSPAFFEFASGGNRFAAALDENYALITPNNPAQRGRVVQFYVNGLGAVTNQPASGEAGAAAPLASTVETPMVSIGGQTATVQFSGLAPGVVGVYQVNAIVPIEISPGLQSCVISIGGTTSRTTLLAVQ